jgi:hypothetical protein
MRKGFGVRTKGKRFNWRTEFSQFYVFLKVVHKTKFYQGKRFSIEPSKSLYSFFIVAWKNFSIEISLRFFCEDKMRNNDDNRTILVFKGLKARLQLVYTLYFFVYDEYALLLCRLYFSIIAVRLEIVFFV